MGAATFGVLVVRALYRAPRVCVGAYVYVRMRHVWVRGGLSESWMASTDIGRPPIRPGAEGSEDRYPALQPCASPMYLSCIAHCSGPYG